MPETYAEISVYFSHLAGYEVGRKEKVATNLTPISLNKPKLYE